MEQEDLGFGIRRKSTGDPNRLGDGSIVAQIVLTGLPDLAGNREKRPLEILEIHINDWIMKRAGIGLLERFDNFRDGHPLNMQTGRAIQTDIPIRLYRHRLIEFRRKRKRDGDHIFTLDLISGIPLLQCGPVRIGRMLVRGVESSGSRSGRSRSVSWWVLGPYADWNAEEKNRQS